MPKNDDDDLPDSQSEPKSTNPKLHSSMKSLSLKSSSSSSSNSHHLRQPVSKPIHSSLKDPTLSPEERLKIQRSLEISALSTRYKQDLVQETSPDGSCLLVINHQITDPDFPFDLPSVLLQFHLPPPTLLNNNSQPMKCEMLNTEIPTAILQNINQFLDYNCKSLMLQQFQRQQASTPIKSLISTLEANLEKLLSGEAFVKAESVKIVKLPTPASRGTRHFECEDLKGNSEANLKCKAFEPQNTESNYLQCDSLHSKTHQSNSSLLRTITNPPARTIPLPLPPAFTQQSIQVTGELRSWNGISVALLCQADLQIKCSKCSHSISFSSLSPGVIASESCPRCTRKITVQFFSTLMHPKSPILCWLQIKGGSPLAAAASSISNCHWQIECDECDEDYIYESKLLNVLHISTNHVGQEIKASCRKCHQKMSFAFREDNGGIHMKEPSISSPLPKTQKIPGLVIGQPLPERGTCKHYRKSFRWLRFPCCGKVFPCPTCHDDDEVAGKHEAQWATRMICGHCSREGPFSDSKCVCGALPNAAAGKSRSFWEGGKGSRNCVTMSRKDSHKYRGQTKGGGGANQTSGAKKR